ncbi:DNA primase [soil metagenome]
MPGRINHDDIQALRERADIAAVVGDYTALKRAGTRWKGLCPFHQEKTPSFTVDSPRGLFYCFGCQAGGDAIAFLQRAEALTFPEAVERLAAMVGHELRYEALSPGQRKALGRRTRLTQAAAEAASFFRAALAGDAGGAARAYLAERGLTPDDLERFRIGWAPDSWDALARHLRARGFDDDEVADAGLASRGRNGLIDRFRGRVVFPILDNAGRDVVAFGGRVVPGIALRAAPPGGDPPKYVNSPETELYHKSRTLYGLNWARGEAQRRDTVLVVEGYLDVIGLHRNGAGHAVATCGTALTQEHFHQLERFARRVVLALDADAAGFAAADRARRLAEDAGVQVGVLPLPPGRDPADVALEGPAAVEAALDGVKTAVEFQLEQLLRTADVSTPESRVDAYRRTFDLLARLEDRFLRYGYIRDLVAPAVRLPADRIERELDERLARRPRGGATRRPAATPAGRLARAVPQGPHATLQREVLLLALQAPHLLPDEWAAVRPDDFEPGLMRDLFGAMRRDPAAGLQGLLDGMPDDDARTWLRALVMSETTVEPDTGKVASMIARLRALGVERRRDAVRERLSRLNPQTDADEHRTLFTRLVELEGQRSALLEGMGA